MRKIRSNLATDLVAATNFAKDYIRDDSGVLMAYEPATIVPDSLKVYADEISKIRNKAPLYVMLNKVAPNILAPVHTDTLPVKVERWHLPLITNTRAYWWDEDNGFVHMEPGYWHGPVPIHRDHTIFNMGRESRVHLIIDLEG